MDSENSQFFRSLFFLILTTAVFSEAFLHALGQRTDGGTVRAQNGFGRRVLMSFKEKPAGSNLTFECSPSGPCVPCLYSEKGDNKYRCSETGYRIPLKCVEIKESVKQSKKTNSQNARTTMEVSNSITKSHEVLRDARAFTTSLEHRSLLDSSSTSDNSSQAYITYRSCIPPATEEKLSVLSFEGIVIFMLLVSGSIIYLRKKKAVSVSGYAAVRLQTNSRF
ncbi:putative transmembrane protein [Senna tora]|uniref:Putative transmembrane protein n=1 Tax=Senna tora TaxID=362788 RepID=A0A834TWT4_9FABA|nr:putative transmembrane protein [Senna tora]